MSEYISRIGTGEGVDDPIHMAAGAMVRFIDTGTRLGYRTQEAEDAQVAKDEAFAALEPVNQARATELAREILAAARRKH